MILIYKQIYFCKCCRLVCSWRGIAGELVRGLPHLRLLNMGGRSRDKENPALRPGGVLLLVHLADCSIRSISQSKNRLVDQSVVL